MRVARTLLPLAALLSASLAISAEPPDEPREPIPRAADFIVVAHCDDGWQKEFKGSTAQRYAEQAAKNHDSEHHGGKSTAQVEVISTP